MDEIEKLNLLYGRTNTGARSAIKKAVTVFQLELVDESTGEYLDSKDLINHLEKEDSKINNMKKNNQSAEKNQYETQSETQFIEGIIAFRPKEGAPEFILSDIVINPKELNAFLREHPEAINESEKYGEQVRLTLKTAKNGGGHYLQLSNYKKES